MTRDDPAAFVPPPAFGPFRVLHQVGVGALGPVFRTYEPTRDRLIAVKVFRLDITPEQAQALADELAVAADAGLFHPSIVEPVASGVEGTAAYRAEEYVAGESLDVAIRHYAPATPDKALPFITQLAGAIDFARAAGIGHGALHLRDIFVTPDEARASGFGVVEALERIGLRAPVRRPYSAPERIAGGPWGRPADVFSLAAISYELLTGRRPSGTGEQIAGLGPEVGQYAAAMHAVLARAMHADPSRRHGTALEFASALEAAARGERVTGAIEEIGAIEHTPAAALAPERPEPAASATTLASGAAGLAAGKDARQPPARDLEDVEGDVDVERDLDDAHHGLLQDEQPLDDASDAVAYDEDEAVEDLALEPPPARFADDFTGTDDVKESAAATTSSFLMPERPHSDRPDITDRLRSTLPAPPADDVYVAAAASRPDRTDEDDSPLAGVAEPPRSAMFPRALMLIIGLLVGFAAGYSVGTRKGEQTQASAAVTGTSSRPADPAAGTGTPPVSGQPYSEQAVSQPSTPTAADTPAPAAPAVPAPPSRPVPTTGTVSVRSTPARANVTMNGKWVGRTPVTLGKVPFGTHSIRVVQDGYAVAAERIVLSADDPSRTVNVRLERAPSRPPARPAPSATPREPAASRPFFGAVYVDSRPRGAKVFLDGKLVGTTPLRIPEVGIGSHVVRLELDDHRTWTSSTRVSAGEETRVTGSLERIR